MKFYKASFIIAFLASSFTACKLSKDISVPNANLPKTYRGSRTNDMPSVGGLPWKDFFDDDVLKSLIADALQHNNNLQIALKNIDAASLSLWQAKFGNSPTVNLQASALSTRPSDNSLNGLSLNQALSRQHIEDYTLSATLNWEADIWGKVRDQKAFALAAYLGTQEARKLLQTKIVADLAKGYYNLLMLNAQLEIAKANVLLNDSTLRIIKLQFNSGQVTLLAVQQAEAQRLAAAGLIPGFERQMALQENAISILTGSNPGTVIHDRQLSSVSIPEVLSAGLPDSLLAFRPDVHIAELNLSKANAEVGIAKANMYPSLTINAQGGLDAFKASNWFNIPASLFGSVAGSVLQPVFQQKKLKTRYEIAKINREQTVIQFRQVVLIAVGEVSDAYLALEKLKTEQDLALQRTNMLMVATRNSKSLFNNGMATYLEVITAQGSVLQSELELAGLRKSRLDAMVDLYRAAGGGWK
ncbi:efflux transporter outer membrane subunit [Mucilaginibacter rigui]|uniref:Efflux transporter outer membrane subunit n=2 Tax=Mucilaginibacter rigui TaxID=534635 RepID=A0ABR7X5Z2_9SPHI|nr:efflux transporter outer membrane subunit [Mucilaginibacter rigui]